MQTISDMSPLLRVSFYLMITRLNILKIYKFYFNKIWSDKGMEEESRKETQHGNPTKESNNLSDYSKSPRFIDYTLIFQLENEGFKHLISYSWLQRCSIDDCKTES